MSYEWLRRRDVKLRLEKWAEIRLQSSCSQLKDLGQHPASHHSYRRLGALANIPVLVHVLKLRIILGLSPP